MVKPTEEQIQRFWKQCGFNLRCPPDKDAYKRGIWDYPNGLIGDLELDLNNLFKYAVPKLYEKGLQVILCASSATHYSAKVFDAFSRKEDITLIDVDPAIALFWAIYKAFNETTRD